MKVEEIEKFFQKKPATENNYIKISFKRRATLYGLFLIEKDYNDLKSKNFWRIVTSTHIDEWNKTKDVNLARIFNGMEFSRLTSYNESFEQA